jgi:Fe-S cluster biogenesis protein NfuA/nitrite reductase/ring-hydroxylating ferredoxin subunit
MIGQEPRELVGNVEHLLDEIEGLADPTAREKAKQVVGALLELYGAALERIVEEVAAHDDGEIAAALADDELVSHVLLLHGLHPVAVEDRVLSGLEEVRPYLESHGGNVELVGIEGSSVHLRLAGSCHGCPSSTMTLKLAIENAIRKAAPEIEEVIAEGQPAEANDSGLLQIEVASGLGPREPQLEPEWTMVGGLRELAGGGTVVKGIGGQPILFAAVGEQFYGYQSRCPGCESSLAGAELHGIEVACPECGHRYDVLRAGRCLDAPSLHLDPVPLLVSDDGLVKVALAVPA